MSAQETLVSRLKLRQGDPIRRDTEIGLFSKRNLENFYISILYLIILYIVRHEKFVFERTEYGKVPILQILTLLKLKCKDSIIFFT